MPALEALPERKQVVGLVAAIGGKVTSADIFATPSLFAEYRQALLESIFVAAADEKIPATPPKPDAVQGFLKKADDAAPKELSKNKVGSTVERRDKGVSSSSVNAPSGAPVYRSYQANE